MTCGACGATVGPGSRFCSMCGAPLVETPHEPREARKYVTVLFADLVGSTTLAERLDPEALRQLIDRYFAVCAESVAMHGGLIEKFIGDAVLAVFGADVSHEDDAVRAVHAAAEALRALRALNSEIVRTHLETLEARCGICSGEAVVLRSTATDFRIIGDVVNTASRLQNAADADEILIDRATAQLVRTRVLLAEAPALTLKGKSQPVSAWRVISPRAGADAGRPSLGTELVGRKRELGELLRDYRDVVRGSVSRSVTVMGAPGIGKSRLVQEFVKRIDGGTSTILRGHCPAYGKDLTYKPLTEMFSFRPEGWEYFSKILTGTPDGAAIRERLAHLVAPEQASPDTGEAGVEEVSWAFRAMLALTARRGPVVLIWEDLQHAGATLLRLIDDVAKWLPGVPVLQICVAREMPPGSVSGQAGRPKSRRVLRVDPLSTAEALELMASLAHSRRLAQHHTGVLADFAATCEGNPLFAELMLDYLADSTVKAVIPPTIQALFGARLDQLPGEERRIVELAAVAGRDFPVRAVQSIAGSDGMGDSAARDALSALEGRGLVEGTATAGVSRFPQAFFRDTAYAFTPKSRRERWHRELAGWYATEDGTPGGGDLGSELLLAGHVEAAWNIARELRPGTTAFPDFARRAAGTLITRGEEALARRDLPAAAGLLSRGLALMPPGDPGVTRAVLHAADACLGQWDADAAHGLIARAKAAQAGHPPELAAYDVQEAIVDLRLGRIAPGEAAAAARDIALAVHEARAGDQLAGCRLLQLDGYLNLAAERAGSATISFTESLSVARGIGDMYEEERIQCAICELYQWSPASVAEGLRYCAQLEPRFTMNRALLVPVLLTKARLYAISDDLDSARATLNEIKRCTDALHLDIIHAATLEVCGLVELLSINYAAAFDYFHEAETLLRDHDQPTEAGPLRVLAARALFELGDLAGAGRQLACPAGVPARATSPVETDLRSTIIRAALRGRVAAADGKRGEALTAAGDAVRLSERTEDPCLQGDAHLDLASVLRTFGDPRARRAAATALAKYRSKGAGLLARRAEGWLAGRGASA